MTTSPIEPADEPGRRAAAAVLPFEFCVQASLLFRQQGRLGLHPDALPILLQLAELWWAAERQPFAARNLAGRLGLRPREMNPHLTAFEADGLVRCDQRAGAPVRYDLSGLFRKLRRLEADAARADPRHASGAALRASANTLYQVSM
jgi:hypothetical protein